MSSRLIVRVTPYAAFDVPTKIEQYQAAGMCCQTLTSKPFCAMCGAAVKPQTKERVVEEARICDLAEEIKEVLHGHHLDEKRVHVWVPNEQRGLPELPSFDPTYSEPGELAEITADLVEASIAAFKKSFAGALAQLQRAYKAEPRIGFGAVSYRR